MDSYQSRESYKGAFPKRKPIYYTISRQKWAEVESADDARRRLKEKLSDKFSQYFFGVSLKRSDNSHTRYGVSVDFRTVKLPTGKVIEPPISFEQFKASVPTSVTGTAGKGTKHETTISGIPVTIQHVTEEPETSYDYKYDNVPGGCYYETESKNGWISYGTIGTPAKKNSNNDPVLVTSGHTHDHNEDGTIDVYEIHQPRYDGQYALDWVGDAYYTNTDPDFDVALADVTSSNLGIKMDYAANDGGYKGYPITGTLTRTYLKDNVGMNLEKQGSSTGTVTGTVKQVSDTWLKLDAPESKVGDSGGPYFEPDCGRDSCSGPIGAIHRGTIDGTIRKGILTESIENQLNITV